MNDDIKQFLADLSADRANREHALRAAALLNRILALGATPAEQGKALLKLYGSTREVHVVLSALESDIRILLKAILLNAALEQREQEALKGQAK